MKKALIFFATVLICLPLMQSCFAYAVSYEEGAFFSEEVLSEKSLAGMPMPELENCTLSDGYTLYMNLTDEEYEAYASELFEWLEEREDIRYLGIPVDSALDAEIFRYDILAPLSEDYDPLRHREQAVIFSTKELSGRNGDRLSDPTVIELRRGELDRLPFSSFEYNTALTVGRIGSYAWDACYFSHSFDAGSSYPVPGSERRITVRACEICGATDYSDVIANGKSYGVTVIDGEDLVARYIPDKLPAGALCHVYTGIIYDASIKVTVNGTDLGPCEAVKDENDRYCGWKFSFIMPCEDIEISLTVAGGWGPDTYEPTLAHLEPWLAELTLEDISAVRTVTEHVGVAPGSFKNILTTADRELVHCTLSDCLSASLTPISEDDYFIDGGGALTVEFLLSSGEVKRIHLNNGHYANDGQYFDVYGIEPLLEWDEVSVSYSFVTYSDTLRAYLLGDAERYVGEYSGLEALEFVPAEGAQGYAYYRLECDVGELFVVSDDLFYCVDGDGTRSFYRLVGNLTFEDILDG